MICYRVKFTVESGVSAGFAWFETLREAQNVVGAFQVDNPTETAPEIDRVEIYISRQGVLRALNHYATHPDNG